MGTDIHGCWEAKERRTGKWLPFESIRDGRNYLWFGIVANMRTDDKYAFDFKPRGKPEETCKIWREEIDVDWMHGHTWLTPSEIEVANQKYKLEEVDYWGEFHRQSPSGNYELTMAPETKMTKILTAFDYPEDQSIPWAGTIRDFIGEDADFEKCVRYVIAFDS